VILGIDGARARFWAKVDIAGSDECWEWSGGRNAKGYGIFFLGGSRLAPRVAYEMSLGQIPGGMCVRHSCDNPPCVNPSHLSTGTPSDNVRDRVERGRSAQNLGEAHGRAKLTDDQVRWLRSAFASGTSKRSLAQSLGVTRRTAKLAIEGRTWGHIS